MFYYAFKRVKIIYIKKIRCVFLWHLIHKINTIQIGYIDTWRDIVFPVILNILYIYLPRKWFEFVLLTFYTLAYYIYYRVYIWLYKAIECLPYIKRAKYTRSNRVAQTHTILAPIYTTGMWLRSNFTISAMQFIDGWDDRLRHFLVFRLLYYL